MRLALACAPVLLLVGCSISGDPGRGGTTLASLSASGASITPIINREIDAPGQDGAFSYTDQLQIVQDDTSGLAFRADMILFEGPCNDEDACLFQANVSGWPAALRVLLYTREPGADWQAFQDLTPGVNPECLATSASVQVDATFWNLAFYDQNGNDCAQAQPGDAIPAIDPDQASAAYAGPPADAQYGLLVYPAWSASQALSGDYAYATSMSISAPPAAPAP